MKRIDHNSFSLLFSILPTLLFTPSVDDDADEDEDKDEDEDENEKEEEDEDEDVARVGDKIERLDQHSLLRQSFSLVPFSSLPFSLPMAMMWRRKKTRTRTRTGTVTRVVSKVSLASLWLAAK